MCKHLREGASTLAEFRRFSRAPGFACGKEGELSPDCLVCLPFAKLFLDYSYKLCVELLYADSWRIAHCASLGHIPRTYAHFDEAGT